MFVGLAAAVVLTVLSGLAIAVNAQPLKTGKPEVTSFAIAAVTNPTFGGSVILAQDNGYFRDEGLNVDLKFFATGVAQKEPLVSGQIAVGVGSVQVWMTMRAAGAPISVIARSTDVSQANQLIVNNKIKQPKDLEGKKIGYLKGTSLDAFYRRFCEEYGVDTKKIEALNMSEPEMVASLLQGHVDAIFISGILGPATVKKGAAVGARLMHTTATSWLTGKPEPKRLLRINILLMANEEFARKNPNTMAAFLRAVARANDEIHKNPNQHSGAGCPGGFRARRLSVGYHAGADQRHGIGSAVSCLGRVDPGRVRYQGRHRRCAAQSHPSAKRHLETIAGRAWVDVEHS
jgi:ABC-type nitrate/sulfonate/bicarbonate transport system substrate-binding protein